MYRNLGCNMDFYGFRGPSKLGLRLKRGLLADFFSFRGPIKIHKTTRSASNMDFDFLDFEARASSGLASSEDF